MNRTNKFIAKKFIPINRYTPEAFKGLIKTERSEKIYIFDIDETLYPMDVQTHDTQHETLYAFLESTGLSREDARKRCAELTHRHGLALKGILKEYKPDEEQFKMLQVYPKNAFSKIKRDIELRKILCKLKGKKFCLTNSNEWHSFNVLTNLDIIDCFELIFHCDYSDCDFLIKPDPMIYRIIAGIIGIEEHHEVHYFDDRIVNVKAAIKHGWKGYVVDARENHIKEILKKILE
jgi:putative hydrolase of the HAD superfamily